jgi:hypothetical protein
MKPPRSVTLAGCSTGRTGSASPSALAGTSRRRPVPSMAHPWYGHTTQEAGAHASPPTGATQPLLSGAPRCGHASGSACTTPVAASRHSTSRRSSISTSLGPAPATTSLDSVAAYQKFLRYARRSRSAAARDGAGDAVAATGGRLDGRGGGGNAPGAAPGVAARRTPAGGITGSAGPCATALSVEKRSPDGTPSRSAAWPRATDAASTM